MADSKITDLDLYEMLGLEMSATTGEVRRAYRKKALECHPDKNPDNPKASELFQKLTKALEVLLDEATRCAYDKLVKARAEVRQRHNALDERRKRFKEDLEEREKAASTLSSVSPEEKLKCDIERLRKEGAKLVQEEIRLLQEELLKDTLNQVPSKNTALCQLKATWDEEPSGEPPIYTQQSLTRIFSKYGNVIAVALSGRKALIEFEEPKAAELALRIEVGFVQNKLKITYASTKLKKNKKSHDSKQTPSQKRESLAERANRQAAERKRLIEQMMRQDEGE